MATNEMKQDRTNSSRFTGGDYLTLENNGLYYVAHNALMANELQGGRGACQSFTTMRIFMKSFFQAMFISILFLSVSFSDEFVCDEKQVEQGIMPAMMACVNVDIEKKDKELNETYKKIILLSSDEEKKHIKQAQRAWINSLEEERKFVYSIYGKGQNAQLMTLNISLEALKIRVEQLKNHLFQMEL